MNNKKNIMKTIILLIISVVYTFLIKYIDVKAIGPNNSTVGFSSINNFLKDILKPNMHIYNVSDYLGYILFLLVIIYACIGLYQLIKRKNIFKVDKEILILGGFYIVVLMTYVLFEKLAINFRPVLINGELEPSYPSSHTILSLCIAISSLIVSKKYFNKKHIKKINIITITLSALVLILRFICGVHWFTDIIGGIIISSFLLSLFNTIYKWNN